MTKLSPAVQRFLEQGRAAMSPDIQTKARVLKSLEARIAGIEAGEAAGVEAGASGASGAVASAVGSSSAKVASGKLWLALALSIGVSWGWFTLREKSEAEYLVASVANAVPVTADLVLQPTAARDTEKAIAPEPKRAEANSTTTAVIRVAPAERIEPMKSTPSTNVEKERAAPLKPTGSKKNTHRPLSSRSTLLDEKKLISRAQGSLQAKKYSQSLSLLAEHQKKFPHGVLSPERDAARAMATCLQEQGNGRKGMARRFLSAHPNSPLAPRVRKVCLSALSERHAGEASAEE